MAKPDALSRCVDHQPKGDDNEDQIMLLVEQFAPEPPDTPNEHLATKETDTEPSRVHIEIQGSDIMDCVRSCTDRDNLKSARVRRLAQHHGCFSVFLRMTTKPSEWAEKMASLILS